MKKLIRTLALALAFVFVLSACQGASPEIIPEYKVDTSSVDLDGFELKWGFAKSNSDNDDNIFGYIPGTSFADLATERLNTIQTELNCKIEMEYKGFGTVSNNMVSSIMSGSPYYDITTNESYATLHHVRGGYFTPLSGLLDLADTDKYGTPNMLQSVIYKDDVYSVVPNALPDLLYTSFGCPIVVNESLIAQYGHEDPRDFVENGTWTWDKFEECLQAFTTVDGEKTIFGISSHTPYYSMLMFLSNGVTFTEFTDDGIMCGIYTPEGITAMERAQNIKNNTCSDCFNPVDSTAGVVDSFKNGECVLLVTGSSAIIGTTTSIMYEMDNVGIIPFPQGPDATPGVYTSYHETLLFTTGIPINAQDSEAAATVLDMMFEPFEGYETKEDIIEYLADQVFFDVRDAQVFYNMLQNTEYTYQNDGARAAIEGVMGTKSVTEVLEGLEEVYAELLEKNMKPHYEGRLAVYGE